MNEGNHFGVICMKLVVPGRTNF